MSNYPPGMGYRDKVRAGIIEPHSHEHEFEPLDAEIILEDGAAILIQECIYAEGKYGQGYSCEEKKDYRFEADWIQFPDGERKPLPDPGEEIEDEALEHAFMKAEIGWRNSNGKFSDVDPDPNSGFVSYTFEIDGESYLIRYSA